ncbi:MAG: flagellar motor protein MotB, partial [Sciscionella sp.]
EHAAQRRAATEGCGLMPARQSRMPGHAGAGNRPGSQRARRQRGGHSGESHEGGAERWLVTYADMLTLLLVLFIVLFSISVVNTSKFISLRTSLASAFGDGPQGVLDGGKGLTENAAEQEGQQQVMPGVPVAPDSNQQSSADTSVDTTTDTTTKVASHVDSAKVQAEVDKFKKIEQRINAALDREGMHGAVQFSIDRRGLIITVVTNGLIFPGNSASLLPGGHHILAVIVPPLVKAPNNIEVDGHTNQEKVSTYPYPSGWELSSARASAVVRDLISGGVSASRLSAVGYSDQRPLYPPSDPRSITRNRRVDIVVLSSLPAVDGDALKTVGAEK